MALCSPSASRLDLPVEWLHAEQQEYWSEAWEEGEDWGDVMIDGIYLIIAGGVAMVTSVGRGYIDV